MIEIYGTDQSTGESRTHFVDFTNDLPGGVTVSSATAALSSFPVGGTATTAVGVISANVVPVTVSAVNLAGQYKVDVTATLSDTEKSVARIIITVSFASVRAGMVDLINNLRGMGGAGVNDYSIGGIRFWSDGQLQTILDRHKSVMDFHALDMITQRSGSGFVTRLYDAPQPNWEQPAVVMNVNGSAVGTALYTMDHDNGRVTFASDTAMAPYYISGTVYNLYGAAAEIWRTKAAHYATAYDISTDNHSLKRSQLMTQANLMAAQYASMASPGASVYAERGDM